MDTLGSPEAKTPARFRLLPTILEIHKDCFATAVVENPQLPFAPEDWVKFKTFFRNNSLLANTIANKVNAFTFSADIRFCDEDNTLLNSATAFSLPPYMAIRPNFSWTPLDKYRQIRRKIDDTCGGNRGTTEGIELLFADIESSVKCISVDLWKTDYRDVPTLSTSGEPAYILVAPDMPPVMVREEYIEPSPVYELSPAKLTYIEDTFGSDVVHLLTDEQCEQIIEALHSAPKRMMS